jgi:hypothetical protein
MKKLRKFPSEGKECELSKYLTSILNDSWSLEFTTEPCLYKP